ncbi:MAG: NAD-dependent epimerase/dehydratase family protein [Candidatus Dormibacteria bacterium]
MPLAQLPQRVAVTGGAGFIGSHTVRSLLAAGVETLVIDDFRHACSEPLPSAARAARCDIASQEAHAALVEFRPQAVLHLAAEGGVGRSLRDPAGNAQTNVAGTVALLQAVVDAGCPKVVFASSGGAIYGRARRLPSRERDRAMPLSAYGASKLAGEAYLGMFGRTFGLHWSALRYGNVYGPWQDGRGEAGVVAISCQRLLQGQAALVTGDGTQARDFVYVGDVARANLLALSSPAQGLFNIGTGQATPIAKLVSILLQQAGSSQSISYLPARPGEVRLSCLDHARAEARLGWQPGVGLPQGLAETVSAFATGPSRAD